MAAITRTTVWASAAMLAIGIAVGILFLSPESPSSAQPDTDPTIQAMRFETPGRADRRVILDLGGLTITAKCKLYRVVRNPDRPYANTAQMEFDALSVTAKSAFGGASIVSSFLQREGRKGPATYPYVFTLREFGPGYGAYDFLGSPYKVAGDLQYSRPDGGQVSVSYATNQQATTDGCSIAGTGIYAPG